MVENVTFSNSGKILKYFTPFLIYISMIAIIGIISNVLILFFYNFKKIFHPNDIFIKLMAIVDILMCGVCGPCVIILEMGFIPNAIICKITMFIYHFLISTSSFTFIFIAIERWFCICKPLLKLTQKHIKMMLMCIGIISLIAGGVNSLTHSITITKRYSVLVIEICFPIAGKLQEIQNFTILFFYINGIIILYSLYALIYKVIYSRSLRLGRNKVGENGNISKDFKLINKNNIRTVTMLFGVTTVYLISWLPFLLETFGILPLNIILYHIYLIQNSTNFFIYIIFQEKFRYKLVQFFFHKLQKSNNSQSRITNLSVN